MEMADREIGQIRLPAHHQLSSPVDVTPVPCTSERSSFKGSKKARQCLQSKSPRSRSHHSISHVQAPQYSLVHMTGPRSETQGDPCPLNVAVPVRMRVPDSHFFTVIRVVGNAMIRQIPYLLEAHSDTNAALSRLPDTCHSDLRGR